LTPFIDFRRVALVSEFPKQAALKRPKNKGVADEGDVVACCLRSCQRRQGTL
jgi:hypothetical protein